MKRWDKITDECIRQFADGDLLAFEQIQEALQTQVLGLLINRCNDKELAADVAQDTWLKIWTKRQSVEFRSTAEFRSWIFQIAKRRLIDCQRKTGRNPETGILDGDNATASGNDMLLSLERREELAVLKDCLDSLDGNFADALRMKNEGLSTEQISAEARVSPGTVYTRLHRGMRQLKDCVEGKLQ